LETLAAEHRPRLTAFAAKIQERGGDFAPILQSGRHPRLAGLIGAAVGKPKAPPLPPSVSSFKPIESSHADAAALKDWMTQGRLPELAGAYPLLDSFRTRRAAIDRAAEIGGPDAVSCLIYMLAHEGDDASANYLLKKIVSLDPAAVEARLNYDPNDRRLKAAVVQTMAVLQSEACLEPLSRALADAEPGIRLNAIRGVQAMVDADADWIGRLGAIVRRDGDARVRLEAARALREIDSPEALHEMEAASRESDFDAPLKQALAELVSSVDAKFKKGRPGGERRSGRDSIVEKEGFFASLNRGQILKLCASALILAAAVALAKYQFDKYSGRTIQQQMIESGLSEAEIDRIREEERLAREFRQREMIDEERRERGLPPIPHWMPLPENPYADFPIPTPTPTG
jgi:HEAT repeat protein